MYQNCVRLGIAAGLGAIAGALAVFATTRGNNPDLRKSCVSLLSHGLELKDKVTASIETARENLEDFTAEARHAAEVRKTEAAETAAQESDGDDAPSEAAKPAGKKPTKHSRSSARS